MDPMVSSRVPASFRDRVNTRLKEIGSNPAELINKAYEYVDVTGELPHPLAMLNCGHAPNHSPMQNIYYVERCPQAPYET